MKIQCKYIQKCSGCSTHEHPLPKQAQLKEESLQKDLVTLNLKKLVPITMIPTFEAGFRDKVDLTLETTDGITRIGFYEKYRPEEHFDQKNKPTVQQNSTVISSHEQISSNKIFNSIDTNTSTTPFFQKKKILDIPSCPLFSKNLSAFYEDFRKVAPNIKKGSVRLRVSQEGKRGLWLDFSNNDINQLLDSQIELKKLYEICDTVEIGQKRKTLLLNGNKLEFQYSKLQPWFETYISNVSNVSNVEKTKFYSGGKLNNSSKSQVNNEQNTSFDIALNNKQNDSSDSKMNIEQMSKKIDFEKNEYSETESLINLPLYLNIAGFSQTGLKTNKIIIGEVLRTIAPLEVKSWLELCSGSGNLTFPIAAISEKLTATELDPAAISGMRYSIQKNIEYLKSQNLSKEYLDLLTNRLQNIKTEQINIHKPNEKLKALLQEHQGLFVDPPRSGLGDFLENMNDVLKSKLPKHFIYLSCFQESLLKDMKKAISLGYKIKTITGIDQFPHTQHCEWLVHLSL